VGGWVGEGSGRRFVHPRQRTAHKCAAVEPHQDGQGLGWREAAVRRGHPHVHEQAVLVGYRRRQHCSRQEPQHSIRPRTHADKRPDAHRCTQTRALTTQTHTEAHRRTQTHADARRRTQTHTDAHRHGHLCPSDKSNSTHSHEFTPHPLCTHAAFGGTDRAGWLAAGSPPRRMWRPGETSTARGPPAGPTSGAPPVVQRTAPPGTLCRKMVGGVCVCGVWGGGGAE
jgi:hypothetical protein